MNRLLSCSVVVSTVCRLVSLVAVLDNCSLASAQPVVINFTDRDWYNEKGIHYPIVMNYFVGDSSGRGCGASCDHDVRNFFVFDLSSVTLPVASAKLELYVPSTRSDLDPRFTGYKSPDPSEDYELHDVTTQIASLLAGVGGVATHADLGSGVVYGSRTMTAADMGSMVEITLNAATIAALNSSHGLFGIGGSLTTLDALENQEYTFGITRDAETPQLRLTLVPEPSTLLLLGIGAISLLGYRRRHR